MANRELIDRINEAFLEVVGDDVEPKYRKFINAVNRDILNLQRPTKAKIRKIVQRHKPDMGDSSLMFAIMGAVTHVLNNPQLSWQDQQRFAPVLLLMGAYSVSNPKRFAKTVKKMSSNYGLSDRERKYKRAIDQFKKQNERAINRATKEAIRNAQEAQLASKSKIADDYNTMQKQGMKVSEIRHELNQKYKADIRTRRTLNTELHEHSENTKVDMAEDMGMTTKEWVTQGDERVRSTPFHNGAKGQVIPIKDSFKVGGQTADKPGAMNLPPEERINCRCYLVFH